MKKPIVTPAELEGKNSKSRILITGGCGFIGVNLINFLLRRNFHSIRILDNLTTGTKDNLEDALGENGETISERKNNKTIYEYKNISNENIQAQAKIELITADIRSYDLCLEATRNIDAVIHLAAHTRVTESLENPEENFMVNSIGTFNVLEASRKNRVEKFIFASSNAAVGEQVPPINEEMIPKPMSPYGASKLYGEALCSSYFFSYGMRTVSLRFANAYGLYSEHKSSVVAEFIRRAIQNKPLVIYGDGNQTRDFVHARDICQAIELALNPHQGTRCGGEIFQVGTGAETKIIDLAKMIKKLCKEKDISAPEIILKAERKGEIKFNYSNIKKAKKILRFSPEEKLSDGIKEILLDAKNKIVEESI